MEQQRSARLPHPTKCTPLLPLPSPQWNSIQLNAGKDFSQLCEKCRPTVPPSLLPTLPEPLLFVLTCRGREREGGREMVECKDPSKRWNLYGVRLGACV